MGSELNRVMQKYNIPNQGMAQTLGAMGRGNDSLVAHITPREAMMLKAMGGSGTINPRTGLLEFYDADSSGNAADSGNPTGGDDGGVGIGDGAFGGSVSPEQAAQMAALEAQASAALSAFAATPDTLNDPALAQAFMEAADARDAFAASLGTSPTGGGLPGMGSTYGAPATQSGLGTTATNVSAVENSPGMGANVGTTSMGGGYNNSSGDSTGGVQPNNFEALYGQTLGRAPEAGALAFWANYANTHGIEAAQAAFNYGAAQEIAARNQAAATANVPGGLAGVTTGVATGSGTAASNTSGAGSDGLGGGAGGGGMGSGGMGSGGMGSGNMGSGSDSGGYIPPAVTAPIVTTTPVTTAPVTATAPVTTTTPAPTSNFQFAPYSAPASYGFELNRLMQQYGVSTPTMMPFAGYTTQTTPDDARRAEYDRTAYQNYVNQFNNRLAQTNMYNRAQFVPEPAKFTPQYSAPIANPAYAPTNYGGIYNTYTKYFGRTPEEAGVQYWGKTGATGDALQNAILSGAQNADLEYLRSQYPDMNYARGGAVKTRYAEGGEAEGPETERSNRGSLTPEAAATPNAAATPTPAPTPAQPAPITATGSTRLAELLNQYARPSTDYARELGEARRRSQSETEAFSNMIQQMSQRGESPTSRAEMYFRLASAFGSPTRTGMFTENLALVGKEMGEFAKGRRAEEAERRGLSLKAQELRMTGAREDLATTRALAGQEAAERRAINSKIVEAYVRSGEPQSAAGKAAVDEGLRPGTPEYQARVQQLTDLNVSRMQELINAQQDNIRLRNESSQQLSTPEMNVLNDAMQNVSTARDNLASLRQALALNPNTAPSNLTQGTLNEVRRRLGSTSPTVVNTDELVNILSRLSLNSLKETFPGAISNDERRALQEVQGINAQNLESRRRILERAIASLETMIPRTEARIAEIRSGAFGRRTPQEVATPPGGASAPGAVTSSSPGAVTSASPGAVAPAGGR